MKLSLFTDMVLHLKKGGGLNATRKLLNLMNTFNNVAGYKCRSGWNRLPLQKHMVFQAHDPVSEPRSSEKGTLWIKAVPSPSQWLQSWVCKVTEVGDCLWMLFFHTQLAVFSQASFKMPTTVTQSFLILPVIKWVFGVYSYSEGCWNPLSKGFKTYSSS